MSTHAQLQPVKFDYKAMQGRVCPLPILPMIHQSETARHCREMAPVQSTCDRDLALACGRQISQAAGSERGCQRTVSITSTWIGR